MLKVDVVCELYQNIVVFKEEFHIKQLVKATEELAEYLVANEVNIDKLISD